MIATSNKGRILYADVLRIITIIGIIIFHVSTNRWAISFYEAKDEWHVLNIFVSMLRWCVPVFFMLSGMIFLDPNYNLSFKKLYTKSIPRLLCALIFWSLFYRILSPLTCIVLDIRPVGMEDVHRLYSEIIFGVPWHHLWFLYPLIGLYILSPLLRIFTANAKREHYIYFLAIFLIFGAAIPLTNELIGKNISFGIYELNSYLGYFIAGYFFSKFDLTQIEKRIIYALGISSLIAIMVLTVIQSNAIGAPMTTFFDRKNPLTMFTAYFIFVFAKEKINGNARIMKLENNRYITKLAIYGFGIYLVHDLFNVILGLLYLDTSTFPTILAVPTYSIFVYSASLVVTVGISKIPGLNKWIM